MISSYVGENKLFAELYLSGKLNFNPNMATAGTITVAEVEEIVAPGSLDPDGIYTPGIYVDRIFKGSAYAKRIEQRTVRKRAADPSPAAGTGGDI